MTLTISNNSAVASASYYLDKNQQALQMTIKRLASGKRIVSPNEDPGTIGHDEAKRGGQPIVWSEEQCAERDLIRGGTGRRARDGWPDRRSYGRAQGHGHAGPDEEFAGCTVVQQRIRGSAETTADVSAQTFNGVSLFADFATNADGTVSGTSAEFRGNDAADNTIEIFTSSEGSSGTKISLYKSAVLSALTVDASDLTKVNTSGAGKTAMSSDYSQAIPEQLSRSASPDCRWECSNRRYQMSRIFVHKPVVECPA